MRDGARAGGENRPQHVDLARNLFVSWDVSASAGVTELVVILDPELEYFGITDMFDVLSWTQRGFVLATQSSENALLPAAFTRLMQRVYDLGILADRRDFNGDGVAGNARDLADFNAAYALYAGKSNCRWVHGDMNGDHVVHSSDHLLFTLRRNQTGIPGQPYVPIPINLGVATRTMR